VAGHAPYRPSDDGGDVDVTRQRTATDPASRGVTGTRGSTLGVLVCTHAPERVGQLARAVASLDTQTRVPDEVLVLVDGTAALAEHVRGSLPATLPRTGLEVRVEALGRNRGVSVARTSGAALLQTDLVAFLDDDAVAEPGWLACLEAPLQDPSVLGSSGRSEADFVGPRPAWLPDEFLWTVGCSYAGMPTGPARVRNVYGGCAVVQRRLFLDLGGYDPRLGHGSERAGGGEEADFCLRATAATGGEFAFEPSAVIRHRVPANRLTWRYYLTRCRSEGELKALLADRAPAGSLGPETAFARALPLAVLRALVHRDRRPQALGMVAGAAAVVLGLVRGTARTRLRGLTRRTGRMRG
jgi:GT2 family glycosyltransferase